MPLTTGPKVAGTYTGFVGVFVGVGIFTLILLSIFIFLRFRHLRRTNAAAASSQDRGSDFHRNREEHEEAFEMPRSWRGQQGGDLGNESTASFDPAEFRGADGGDGGREGPFYSNLAESRSREVFLEPVGQGGETRYDDPFERKEGQEAEGERRS